jgi:tRNA (mo5U34)-methyltransferase
MLSWTRLQMPEDMTGKSFLEIGCWEGNDCAEAVNRGARLVVGVDLCTCQPLFDNVKKYRFDFVQMDISSEKFWELPQFDVVLCAGVLYHLENPLAAIFRLRKTVLHSLYLETEVHRDSEEKPTMMFFPTNELGRDYSNWWAPNKNCLHKMLEVAGFSQVEPVYSFNAPYCSRYGVRALVSSYMDLRKILPRPEDQMSLAGGTR